MRLFRSKTWDGLPPDALSGGRVVDSATGRSPAPPPVHREGLEPKWDMTRGAVSARDTNIPVENPHFFVANDLIKVPRTGEAMLVVFITGRSLGVIRGVGSTAPAPLYDNDDLMIIGNAYQHPGYGFGSQPILKGV